MPDIVGEVAVRVVADARGLDKDIERKAESAGDGASKEFMRAWDKDQRKQQYFETIRKQAESGASAAAADINKALRAGVKPVDIKPRLDLKALRELDQFRLEVARRFGTDLSANITDDMVRAQNAAFDEIKRSQVRLFNEVEKAHESALREQVRLDEKAADKHTRIWAAAYAEDARRGKAAARASAREAAKGLSEAMREVAKAQAAVTPDAQRWNESLVGAEKNMRDIQTSMNRIEVIQSRVSRSMGTGLLRTTEDINRSLRRTGLEMRRVRSVFDRVFDPRRGGEWLTNLRHGLNDLGHGTWSRVLGKTLGAVVGGAEVMSRIVVGSVRGVASAVTTTLRIASDGFDLVAQRLLSSSNQVTQIIGTGVQSIGQAFGAIAAATGPIGQVVATIAAITVPIVALITGAGVLAAAISSLAAIMTTMGSAAFYAASGLAVLAPAVASLGLGFGAVLVGMKGVPGAIGAFGKLRSAKTQFEKESAAAKTAEEQAAALDKYNKALEDYDDALKDVTPSARAFAESFDRKTLPALGKVQKLVQESLFTGLALDIEKSTDAVTILGAAFATVAVSVNKVIRYALSAIRDPAILGMLSNLITGLATAFEPLGRAAVNFGLGLAGALNAMLPILDLFAGAVERISIKFLEMTTKVDENGESPLTRFFDKAYKAASTVWNILVQLAGALGQVLSIAQPTGQTFLDEILERAQGLNDWLSEPENKEKVKNWIDEAYRVGVQLKDIIVEIGTTFAELDTPENRHYLELVLGMIEDIVDLIPEIVDAAQTMAVPVIAAFEGIALVLDGIVRALEFITGKKHNVEVNIHYTPIIDRIPIPKLPNQIPFAPGRGPGNAAGGMYSAPKNVLVGEAGPEAIIPLARPLGMVDPSVRGMAAVLRGQGTGSRSGTVPQRVFNADITVNAPQADGRAVATQVVNRMAILAGV